MHYMTRHRPVQGPMFGLPETVHHRIDGRSVYRQLSASAPASMLWARPYSIPCNLGVIGSTRRTNEGAASLPLGSNNDGSIRRFHSIH